jgi:hypothetical protein
LHPTSWGLYTEIIEQIKKEDKFGEALPHLKAREYSKAKKKYDEIDSVEKACNEFISESVHVLEVSIESGFYNLGIKEFRFNGYEFYNLTFIIRAFVKASLLQTLPPLIEDAKPINGPYYTTFTLAGFPIAQCRTYRNFRIRQLINIALEKNAGNMKQIEDNTNRIQTLLDGFKDEIEKIIRDANRTGLKGECIYEIQEWKFFHCRGFPLEGVQ